MTTCHPVPGTDAYFTDRKQAFTFIAYLERAIVRRNRAPMYIGYNYGPDDCDVIENLEPWDHVAELQDQAERNPTVLEILAAQCRLSLLTE